MRVVFDTNVLVSAFLARGLCADLLRLVLSEHTLVSSEVVLDESLEGLSRKGRVPLKQIDAIEVLLRDQPIAPRPAAIPALGLVDADDEWVLASAVLAEADLLVTGDQGVLAYLGVGDEHGAGGKPGVIAEGDRAQGQLESEERAFQATLVARGYEGAMRRNDLT